MIQTLVDQIEAQLGWGNGKHWSNRDFEMLSEEIFKTTKKRLSVTTLKRIWGRAEMVAKPSLATLDILSEFGGHHNWRTFVNQAEPKARATTINGKKRYARALVLIGLIVLTIGILAFFFWPKTIEERRSITSIDKSDFAFASRVVSTGMPNSVVFEYDASKADGISKIEIQQDWDKQKRIMVNKNDSVATCIYYKPGFFKSKLVVNGLIVKENDVFIETEDWLGIIERDTIPIYLTTSKITRDGGLSVDLETLSQYHIDPKISEVTTSLFYVKDFGELYTNGFEMTLQLKNNLKEGYGGCQEVEVYILYDGGAIGIPLAKSGCISNLNLMAFGHYIDGKKNDLSAFGVNFEDFVELACSADGEKLKIHINGALAYELPIGDEAYSIKGVSIHFKGTGIVKNVVFKNSRNLVYSFK